MSPPWSEEGALPGTLVVRFEGVNSAALERMEIENFQRGLSAPEADDPGGTAFATGRQRGLALTPRQGIGVGLGCVLALVGYEIAESMSLGDGLEFAAMVIGFVIGMAILPIGYFLLARRAQVKGVVMTEPFTIEATPDAMTIRGATIGSVSVPVTDVVEIVAAPRLGWRDKSGKFSSFPCGYTIKANNVALAARLTQIAAQVRSMSGYRGG